MTEHDAEPLWRRTAAELTDGYGKKRFTPVEAIASVFERLEAVNPAINAVIAVDRDGSFDAARRSAGRWRAGAPLSGLDGVPVSIKDNLFLKGLPATWGSRLHAGFVPDADEPPVARLRAAGAILFGKTNVPEFTLQGFTGNLVFGTTRNPHAPDRTPGGSTGGGAAAVAAGIGPLAIGTDGGGSLRRPAAHCGLFAMKPSLGQVARHGGFPQLLSDFEVVGAVGRTPADLLSVHDVLAGYDPADPRSLAADPRLPALPKNPRVAFLPRIGAHPVDPRIAAEAERLALALKAETIEQPFDPETIGQTWGTIASGGLAWYLSGIPGWEAHVNPSARAMVESGARLGAGAIFGALAAAAEARRAASALFGRYDFLLCPATAALAWPAGEMFPQKIDGKPVGPRGHAVFTGWMNVAGLAAATVPVAMTPDDGGVGMQIVAGHGRDRDLLAFLTKAPALRACAPAPLAALDKR